MNWNSIVRSASAFAVYMAVMVAYLSSLTPVAFALCLAAVLCIGLLLHSKDAEKLTHFGADQASQTVLPSLSESMAELHSLQNEINELQAQFGAESSARHNPRDGLSG